MTGRFALPIFKWVNPEETTFGPEHQVNDEDVLSISGDHGEGQKPMISIEIKNPRIGFLNPSRKIHCWISVDLGSAVIPVFFGRLVGIPTNLFGEVVTATFISEAPDWQYRKQIAAEPLKVRPYYDPIFLDPAHRDDPDSILEGYSALWHFHRTTLEVSLSDYLIGEDGEEVFTEDDNFYDNFSLTLNQAPLTAINVKGTVTWTQRDIGYIDFGQHTYLTYTGASLISDWPKPLQELGSGWSCQTGIASDVVGINTAIMGNFSSDFQNHEDQHEFGDTMSLNQSISIPIFNGVIATLQFGQNVYSGPLITQILSFQSQIARISDDPDFKDVQPGTVKFNTLYIPRWTVNTHLAMRYDAQRQRTEDLTLTLTSNLQPIITQAVTPALPVEEIVAISGVDVGLPLINVLNWLSVKNTIVEFGQIIFPANPTVPGGTSYQIATVGGLTGNGAIPLFSPIVGTNTIDNAVTWTSLGANLGTNVPDWTISTYMPVGQMIRPVNKPWAYWTDLVPMPTPPPRISGTAISVGQICRSKNNQSFQYCTRGGTTSIGLDLLGFGDEPNFSTVYGTTTLDGDVTWVSLGMTIPDGNVYFVCIVAGVTDPLLPPNFDFVLGNDTTENYTGGDVVVWRSLGSVGTLVKIPLAVSAARSYFPTDRGQWSIEYLICIARAHLRLRARAVQISFDCEFERAIMLSCRKSVRLFDRHLPGGEVTGKIIAYSFKCDGDKGIFIGNVTIGCAVGLGGHVSADAGTPTYVENGYVAPGYQYYQNNTVLVGAGSDIGYSTPMDAPDDDGLVFPLDKNQVVVRDEIRGTIDNQITAIKRALTYVVKTANLQLVPNPPLQLQLQIAQMSRVSVEGELAKAGNSIWRDLEIKPVTNGPFEGQYDINTTMLEIEQQIDLSAAST